MKLLHIWLVKALLGMKVGNVIAYLVGRDTTLEEYR